MKKPSWLVTDKQFYRRLLLLTLPMAGQNIITFAVGLADNVMVGVIGDTALSGVYIANQWTSLFQILNQGFSNAAIILASQYWGRKDTGSIKVITAMTMRLSLVLALVFFFPAVFAPRQVLSLYTNETDVADVGLKYLRIVAFSYLLNAVTEALIAAMKSVETVRVAFYTSLSTFLVNVILNYFLIFGKLGFPAMGVVGAAIATVAARLAEMGYMLYFTARRDRKLRLRITDFKRHSSVLLKDYIHYGIPIFAGSVVWGINISCQNAIMGRLGESAISAASIANNLFNIVSVGLYGVASATSILTGKTVGSGDYALVRKYAKSLQLVFLGVGAVTSLLMFCTQFLVPLLYANSSPATLAISTQLIDVLTVTCFGTAYQVPCLTGIVRAGGRTSFVFINDSLFVFLVVLPLGYLSAFVWNAPVWVVFACLKCDQLLKCIVAVVAVNRFRWIRNITRDMPENGKASARP